MKLKSRYFSRNLPMRKAFLSAAAFALLWLPGCASRGAPVSEQALADVSPLAGYTQRAVLVLPLQQLSEQAGRTNSLSAAATEFKDAMNYEIEFAFGESAPTRWVFAPRIIESSRRNFGVSADPRQIAVDQFIDKLPKPDEPLGETLRSQIRQIVALTDARFALLPVIVRFSEPEISGMRRATMRVVLVDARLAQVRWASDIVTEPLSSMGRAAAASLAGRLAVMAGLR